MGWVSWASNSTYSHSQYVFKRTSLLTWYSAQSFDVRRTDTHFFLNTKELPSGEVVTLDVEDVQPGPILPDDFSLTLSNQTVFVVSTTGKSVLTIAAAYLCRGLAMAHSTVMLHDTTAGSTIILPPPEGDDMTLLSFQAFFADFICIDAPVFSIQDDSMPIPSPLPLPGDVTLEDGNVLGEGTAVCVGPLNSTAQ
eukprot:scaffold7417_cov417-Prasinococcus_capsulatus_cf.AAC.5